MVEYKNVTKVRYGFMPELRMGTFGNSTDWNIMSNLSVNKSTPGVSYFHLMNERVPFTQTIFKKNTLNDSPFPSCCAVWYTKNENAIHLLEMNIDKIDWRWLSRNHNALHLLESNFDKINWTHLSSNQKCYYYREGNLETQMVFNNTLRIP